MKTSAKVRSVFSCQACGHQAARWMGRCQGCGEWNTLVEERVQSGRTSGVHPASSATPAPLNAIALEDAERWATGIGEVDRVLGGGLVKGSAILLGGDPGVGKSTLLLQILAGLAKDKKRSLYVTGEESAAQVALRAERLECAGHEEVQVIATTEYETAEKAFDQLEPEVIVLDSVQTLRSAALDSAAGSVSQLREVTARAIDYAKSRGAALFLIGHVTKDGAIAGPKVLEHLVDTVLAFEGDRGLAFRTLRVTKNRFGAAHELGIFEMLPEGLREVPDPSAMFLAERPEQSTGSVVIATADGSRPLLVEVQALVAPAVYGSARRVASGLDTNRLAILLAVLERKAGLHVLDRDVFASVAGGIRIDERAIDLGLALAVASSLQEKIVDARTVVFGEIGLAGEVRAVQRAEGRVLEAKKLGYQRVILPASSAEKLSSAATEGIALQPVKTLTDAVELLNAI